MYQLYGNDLWIYSNVCTYVHFEWERAPVVCVCVTAQTDQPGISAFFFLFPSSLPFSSHVSTFMKSRRMNPWTSRKISLELRYYQLAAAHLHFGSRLMSTRCLSLSSYAVAIENSCGSSVRLSSPSKDCQSFSAAIKGKTSQSEIRSGLLLQRNKNTDQNHINV